MKRTSRGRQAGLSIITVVILLALLAGLAALVVQAFPTAVEYQAVVRAVERSKDAGTAQDVRNAFEKAAQVDDIKSVGPKDLEISRRNDRNTVSVAWNKEIHMFGPAYLLLKYAYTSK